MKRVIITGLFFLLPHFIFSQEIVNFVLVGDNGITGNIKEAHSFVVIKKYPHSFQRLDYKMSAPLELLRTYADSNLKVLEGNYYEYEKNGSIKISGSYKNNLKEDDWFYYNDTGKVVLEEEYEAGVLVRSINPDTVKDETSKKTAVQTVEKEATFGKGDRDWIKYLSKNLNADLGVNSANGGTVKVMFVVNKEGHCIDVHLKKSVEFILDEEVIRVIQKSPQWHPAIQNGKIVNAYRVQPITFNK